MGREMGLVGERSSVWLTKSSELNPEGNEKSVRNLGQRNEMSFQCKKDGWRQCGKSIKLKGSQNLKQGDRCKNRSEMLKAQTKEGMMVIPSDTSYISLKGEPTKRGRNCVRTGLLCLMYNIMSENIISQGHNNNNYWLWKMISFYKENWKILENILGQTRKIW